MQLGNQEGHNMAIARRACGAALECHLFRTLMVASLRFSRLMRAGRRMVPQLSRAISLSKTRKNISL